MNTHQELRSLTLTSALLFTLLAFGACSDSANEVQAHSSDEQDSTEPISYEGATAERVLARSTERWGLIVEAGQNQERWIEVYEFLAPAVRDGYPITVYLPSKAKFHYDQPSKPKLLKLEEGKAFVAVRATWLAYLNPQVRQVEGGESLTKPFQSIEEWDWVEGEWYLQRPHRESDFHRENPDFFKRASSKKPAAPEPK